MRWLPTRWSRAERPDLPLPAGERLLAWAATRDGQAVGGTRHALYLPEGVSLPWEAIESAEWDQETDVLQVREVGTWGDPRSTYTAEIGEPGRLLELLRERVTASIVLQRHVPIRGRRGVRVIARRAPGRTAEVAWFFEYDEGVDPTDPEIAAASDRVLAEARADVEID